MLLYNSMTEACDGFKSQLWTVTLIVHDHFFNLYLYIYHPFILLFIEYVPPPTASASKYWSAWSFAAASSGVDKSLIVSAICSAYVQRASS